LFNTFLQQTCFGQREIILTRKVALNCPVLEFSLDRCNYGLLVPANRLGKQEVISYTYPSLKPHHFNKTESKDYYLVWENVSFASLNKANLEVSIKIKLHKYDLKTAKKHPIKDTTDMDTVLYLKKDEKNFKTTAKNIEAAAAAINGPDREEIVRSIFSYVKNSLDYHIFYEQDRGAKRALKNGRGDCTEYSELMVTLCRAKNIPARIVMGIIPKSNGTIGYHNWVEVYFYEYGWVAFDPTWADHVKATTTFYSMKNTYIQLSNKRFIQTILNPCGVSGSICNSYTFKDTCTDLSQGISKKITEMNTLYKNAEYEKAGVLLDTLLSYEPDNYSFWMFKGMTYAQTGNFEKGLECIQNSIKNAETDHEKSFGLYALSNFYALRGDGEKAVTYLKEALDKGMDNYQHILKDTDFAKIKDYPPFIELENEIKAKAELLKKKE
jgi:tetratricopeptide (TPR) repeat protein